MGILSKEKYPLQQFHSEKGGGLIFEGGLFSGDYGNGMLANQCNTRLHKLVTHQQWQIQGEELVEMYSSSKHFYQVL